VTYFSEPTVDTSICLLTKLKHYPLGGARVFIDPAGYKSYVAEAQQTFERELHNQQAAVAR
jgi:hypothetical protein